MAGVTGIMAASHFAEGRYLMYFGAYAFASELVPLCGECTCCCSFIMARNDEPLEGTSKIVGAHHKENSP